MTWPLCFLSIALAVAVYPVAATNSDLISVFNFIEIDFFNLVRLALVGAMGVFSGLALRKGNKPLLFYVTLLIISVLASRFPETCLWGTPMHHEGLYAILGYIGIFEISRRQRLPKQLETCFSVVIYFTAFVACLQLIYGNFLNFPLFKLILPKLDMHAVDWPIYANMGSSNHLGLFCSLFVPWAIVRKKPVEFILLAALLILSQSRAAWLSVLITTLFISRRFLIYLALAACLFYIVKPDIARQRIKVSMNEIHWPIRDKDFAGRAYMWKNALPFLKDDIVFGKGPGTFLLYFPQFTERGERVFEGLGVDRPHNMFVNVWESSGLLSAIILFSGMAALIFLGNDMALKMGAIGFLITGLFTDSVLCVTPYFMMFLGGLSYEYDET